MPPDREFEYYQLTEAEITDLRNKLQKHKKLTGPRGIRKFIQFPDVPVKELNEFFDSLLPSEHLEFLRKNIEPGFIFPQSIPIFITFRD
jgi:hypothetical protein